MANGIQTKQDSKLRLIVSSFEQLTHISMNSIYVEKVFIIAFLHPFHLIETGNGYLDLEGPFLQPFLKRLLMATKKEKMSDKV